MKKLLLLLILQFPPLLFSVENQIHVHDSTRVNNLIVWIEDDNVLARYYNGAWDPILGSSPEVLASGHNYYPAADVNSTGDALVTWTKELFPTNREIRAAFYDSSLQTWTLFGSPLSDNSTHDTIRSTVSLDTSGNGLATWTTDAGLIQGSTFNGASWSAAFNIN